MPVDRSVTVKLELDIAGYLANLRAAETATRRFGDSGATSTRRTSDETRRLGNDIDEVGNRSDRTTRRVTTNQLAERHSYSSTRAQVLAIAALVANLPAVLAPALGLLLAVPGAIATAGIAAGTAALAFKGFGGAVKALDSNDITKINEATRGLSPTMVGFAREIQGVQKEWGGLRQSVQAETFAPLLGSARQLTDRVLPMLRAELPQVGRAIGDVGAGFASWLGQGDTLGHVALLLHNVRDQVERLVPFLQAWGSAFVNVSNVAGPFLVKLIDMLTALGSRFDAFLTSARATGQLDTLFKTTAIGVQGLLDLLSKLSEALFTVLSSPGTLQAAKVLWAVFDALGTVIDVFAHALTALPGPLQAVFLVMLALGTMGPLLAKAFQAVRIAIAEVALGAQRTVTWFGHLHTASSTATTGVDRLTQSLRNSGSASQAASRGAGGFVAAFGGPWGLAITGAIVLLTTLMGAMGSQKMKADEAARAYLQFGQAVADARARGNEDIVPSLIKQDKAIQDLIIDAAKYGIASKQVVDALSGEKGANDAVTQALRVKRQELSRTMAEHINDSAGDQIAYDKTGDAAKRERDQIDHLIVTLDKNAVMIGRAAQASAIYNKELGAAAGNLGGYQARIDSLTTLLDLIANKTATTAQVNAGFSTSIKNITESAGPASNTISQLTTMVDGFTGVALTGANRADLFKQVLGGVVDVAAPAADKVGALTTIFEDIANAELSAGQKADLLKAAWEALFKPAVDARIAHQDFVIALNDLGNQLDKNNRSLDDNTLAGAKNAKVVEALIQQNVDSYFANIRNGMAVDKARELYDQQARQIEKTAGTVGLNTTKVHELNQMYGQMPGVKETVVKLTGAAAVFEQLLNLKAAQFALAQNIDVGAAAREIRGQMLNNQMVGHAAGGFIDGAGTATSDSIPIWASKGEYMQRAAAVDYYGVGAMDALNLRKIPREVLAGYATGGLLGSWGGPWPMPVDVSHTKMPYTMAQIQTLFGFGNWPSSPDAQRGDSGVWRKIVALVDSSGIPHSFGNAYRAGDPLWHGSGRAVDWMGYNQDQLAQFFINRIGQVLELIHTTNSGGYYVTRGRRVPSMGIQDELHRNHLHVAMAQGGLVPSPVTSFAHIGQFDNGGYLQPGWNLSYNGLGRPEPVGATAGTNIYLTVNPPAGASTGEIVAQVKRELAWEMP